MEDGSRVGVRRWLSGRLDLRRARQRYLRGLPAAQVRVRVRVGVRVRVRVQVGVRVRVRYRARAWARVTRPASRTG